MNDPLLPALGFWCTLEDLVLGAVTESLSSGKNPPTESCIHWICHQNTQMKMWRLDNVNIRSKLFIRDKVELFFFNLEVSVRTQ